MKGSFYFKHDYDASADDRMVPLRIKMGAEGYGIYWMLIEKLYPARGRLVRDYHALSWELHVDSKLIRQVVEDFGLFYDAKGKIASRRVDLELEERQIFVDKSRLAGKASAAKRALNAGSTPVERPLNTRSTSVQPGEERRGEEKTTAPAAVDLSGVVLKALDGKLPGKDVIDMRLPFGPRKGVYIKNLPADEAAYLLKTVPRLGKDVKAALQLRVEMKAQEAKR